MEQCYIMFGSVVTALYSFGHLRTCSLYVHAYKVNDEAKKTVGTTLNVLFGIIIVPPGFKAPFRMHSNRARDVFPPQSWPTKSFGKREGLQHPVQSRCGTHFPKPSDPQPTLPLSPLPKDWE